MSPDEFLKPKVIISKCIEFEHCRWNGNIIKSNIVRVLKPYVEFHATCPEVEIGLGVPRDPIRVIKSERLELIQPSTMKKFTKNMELFAESYLNSLDNIDGFLLKFKSPSCGLFETKYFFDEKPGSAVIEKGAGLFGREVLKNYPNLAIETEARLTNFRIREHWLTKLYILRNFREVKNSESYQKLIDFQSRNKFLLMAYNQNLMRKMGKIVANPLKKQFDFIIGEYEQHLKSSLSRPPLYTSHINVLMHSLGYFKKLLSSQEKAFFLDELEKYRAGWIPLFILIELIRSWIARKENQYLRQQSYFNPYPPELINFDIKDTWRGRSYWEKTPF